MDPSHVTPINYQFNKPIAPNSFDFLFEQTVETVKPTEYYDYEAKVGAFFEQTKGNSDYEDKVRKFLQKGIKWKKEKRSGDKKKKFNKKEGKKKKKKDKKSNRMTFDLEYYLEEVLKKIYP